VSQIFESENFTLRVFEDSLKASLNIKKDGVFSEQEILTLLEKANIDFESLLIQKIKEPQKEFLIAQKEDKGSSLISNKMESGVDFVKKDGLISYIEGNEKKLECFGDKNIYLEKYVLKNFLGENTYYEKGKIFAKKDGSPYMDEKGKVFVRDKFVIDKDISEDLKEPFYGDLEVFGNLLNVRLEVFGKLTIHGNIFGSTVQVHDFLKVDKDILNYSNVRVSKNIEVFSIKNSSILCGGDIFFEGMIDFGNVICEKSVVSNSHDSVIKFGNIVLGNFLICGNIGDKNGVETKINIKNLPYKQKLIEEMNAKLYDEKLDISSIEKKLELLNKQIEKGIYDSYRRNESDKKYVRVLKYIYPNVTIGIYRHQEKILFQDEKIELFLSNGNLKKRKTR